MGRYASRIDRLADGITRSSADAEEVVQDVFWQVDPEGYRIRGGERRSAAGSTGPPPRTSA
jgi:DNA-directed RNA polymerase specialized sigma24 family protein